MGDTVVLVTACHASSPRVGIDFLPLTPRLPRVHVRVCRIPGGFFKREGKQTEKETLYQSADRSADRPLFPSGWAFETQIIAMVISADTDYDSDVLAVTGAGCALALSECRSRRPSRRSGRYVDGRYGINPTFKQRRRSALDLIIAAVPTRS